MAAKKTTETTPNMIETFREFKENKNIDRTTLVSVLEESFRNVIAKIFGSDENFDVIVNPDKGDFEIYRNRVVVADDEVEDQNKEISLSEAQKIDPDYEIGEDVSETIEFAKFGRRAILNLRQTLASKILELEHDSLYNKYKDRVGQIISGEVYQTWKREVLIVDDEFVTTGSTNFDFRSFEHNFEFNTLVYGKEFNQKMKATFEADMGQCTRLTLAQWKKRPLVTKALESIVRLISPIL